MQTKPSTSHLHARSILRGWLTLFALLPIVASLYPQTSSQTPDELATAIMRVNRGEASDVRALLPDLIAKYQNTPGLLYLEGRLSTDGIEGVKFYQSVVDNFPKCEWADDALYRIYQYYYAIGLYRTADLKLQQLRRDYPNSPRVQGTAAAEIPKTEEPVITLAKKDTVAIDTTAAAVETAPPPDTVVPAIAPAIVAPEASRGYVLQVGAFSTVANAEKQKAFFEDRGFQAQITNKVRSGRSLHLVWLGNFKNSDEAMKFSREIKSKFKITGIVVERY